MNENSFDVAVIGAGLHGLSAALQIARSGRRVVILERRWSGRHASGASAAGVRLLNRDPVEIPLAAESKEMWHRIESIVGDNCGFLACGQVRIAIRPEDLTAAETRLERLATLGYHHERLIDAAELRLLVPNLSPDVSGALVVLDDGQADPHRTLISFRKACYAAGVEIREGWGVEGVERTNNVWYLFGPAKQRVEAAQIVNAAGAWSGKFAEMIGETLPIKTRSSMMIATERVRPFIKPVLGIVGQPFSFKQTDKGTLVLGGGIQGSYDLEKESSRVKFLALSAGAKLATRLFPALKSVRIVRTWIGLEAQTPDHFPIVGPSSVAPDVIHVCGFSGHGFQLVPVMGLIAAELIAEGKSRRPIGKLAADRFSIGGMKSHAA